MIKLKNNWTFFILLISIAVISTALIAEYFFGILPCKMCIFQRYSYYALIILSIIFLLLKKQNHKFYYLTVEAILIVGLFFSIWHVGIENDLINGPRGCSSAIKDISNIIDLKKHILNTPIITCDQINWTFLGISFSIYNTLLQLLLITTNSIFLVKKND